ncbi:MAG: sulfate/thiosulfate transport system substrate-binding protein [Solirubrobacterales bacterium]|jgi:sulfate transport system substrate-binding protein|nr:sulfate/thiosulfate transport system substrate-binding protein [Solirubrobacterales bacterium]
MKTMKSKLSTGMVLLALPLGVAACGGSSDDSGGDGSGGSIDLVAYSTPQTAYEESIIPAFQETEEGADVEFSASFGSSGDQSRAVEAGQPADFVHLPLQPDITRIVESGQVAEDYAETEENGGVVQTSVVSFGVRPGNPKDIQDWDDLIRDDVEVVTPNPFTSGGARWNIMAAYGQASGGGEDQEAGLEYVQQMLENTVVQDASARDSLNTFLGGQGDVLISYENEVIGAQNADEEIDLVIPPDTIQIDTIAVTTVDADEAATAFLDFLFSEEGQELFAENGYRPVDEKVLEAHADEYPVPAGLFTIEDLGGWETVATEFFDPAEGLIADIEADLGVATE